ncbi:MAG: hypothetical protein ABH950_05460 [Candidatus Altiarchaeota archaeon]
MTVKNNKGYFFTIAILLLAIPFLLLVTFTSTQQQESVDDAAGKIRCDELQYFVEDIKRDLDRAMSVFGRRATIYSIDYIVSNNQPLESYTYNNCSSFQYSEVGSRAAIAELMMCATVGGNNISDMKNHTLPVWIDKMMALESDMNFKINITLNNITIVPYDAFTFAIIINNSLNVEDESGLCFYRGSSVETTSLTSIIGLEDPLYPLESGGLLTKALNNCTDFVELSGVVGCAQQNGIGVSGGEALLYSTQIGSQAALETYCQNTDREIMKDKVLVMDQAYAGSCNQSIQDCFLANSSKTFSALIDYEDHPDAIRGTCNATIPWINGTGDLSPPTPTGADPSCGADNSLTVEEDSCIYLFNDGSTHQVLLGINPRQINTTCYRVSNVSGYGTYCPSRYENGPSFFDRMDGKLNLSEKYVNLSIRYFNNPYIGLESLINPYDLLARGITVKTSDTWVDYLYWQNTSACEVYGVCQGVYTYSFRYDCPHAELDNLTSACFSTFNKPPASQINEPADGALYDTCPSNLFIKGNSSDSDGNVTIVDVSWDGGNTWELANGTDEWNISWDPGVDGTYIIQARATDNNGTEETPATGTSVTLDGCGGCPMGWTTLYNGSLDNYYGPSKLQGREFDDENGAKTEWSVDEAGNITLWSKVNEEQGGIGVQETEEQTTYIEINLFPNNCFTEVNFTWKAENNITCEVQNICGNWEANIKLTHNGTETSNRFIGNPSGTPNCPLESGTCPANEPDPIEEGNSGFWIGSVPDNDTIQQIRFEAWSWIRTQNPSGAKGSSDTYVYIESIEIKA